MTTSTRHALDAEHKTTVVHAVGTLAERVRMMPVIAALEDRRVFRQVLIDTGRAQDAEGAGEGLADTPPSPDRWLDVAEGGHAQRTALVLADFERLLTDIAPDLVVLCGASSSALACALAAAKQGIAVAHIESGLRRRGGATPEDIDRVLTDHLADVLLTPSGDAVENLLAEGIPNTRVQAVGNTAVDVLRRHEDRAHARAAWSGFGVEPHEYVLVALHDPAAYADPSRLATIADAVTQLAVRHPVVFAVPPHVALDAEATARVKALTRGRVHRASVRAYLDFLSLLAGAGAVVTDSGGVQDETSALGVACHTLREGTDRPVTLTHGTNVLLGDDPAAIADVHPPRRLPTPRAIPLWDGHAADRIADALVANFVLRRDGGLLATAT